MVTKIKPLVAMVTSTDMKPLGSKYWIYLYNGSGHRNRVSFAVHTKSSLALLSMLGGTTASGLVPPSSDFAVFRH